MNKTDFDVIIIGGGPAGLTAGIYLGRSKAKALIVSDGTIGGQMNLTHKIENYPGVASISGYEMGTIMKKQAIAFGCVLKSNVKITDLSLDGDIKYVQINGKDTFTARAMILATGGKSRSLNVPGETDFAGKGISYCATCDGDFFTDKEIIVVGGGNTALEEAVSLTKYASKVTIVHQFAEFQGFKQAIEEAQNHPKINFMLQSRITEFIGDEQLRKVYIEHIPTGEILEMNIDGVFVFIGYVPQTEMFKGKIELNQWDEIIVDSQMKTAIKGVYAAGDARATKVRQVTTAVADGTIAALSALDFLNQSVH